MVYYTREEDGCRIPIRHRGITTHFRLLFGIQLVTLNEEGDIMVLGVEDAIRDGEDVGCFYPKASLLEGFTFGTLEVGFSELEMAAREAIMSL